MLAVLMRLGQTQRGESDFRGFQRTTKELKITSIPLRNIPANTLFVGRHHVHLPTCHSTNEVASTRVAEGTLPEGTLFTTSHQTAGRGQRGRHWEANAGENLTFTVVLYPTFLPAAGQFLFCVAVALGIRQAVADLPGAAGQTWRVKWPNDLYAGNRKVGGILMESAVRHVQLQHALVGIGLNVNQSHFASPAAASLLTLTGHSRPLEEVLARLLEGLESAYLRLRAGDHDALRTEYLVHLYRYQEVQEFERPDGRQFSGLITGVDAEGRLQVAADGHTHHFANGEVRFL